MNKNIEEKNKTHTHTILTDYCSLYLDPGSQNRVSLWVITAR